MGILRLNYIKVSPCSNTTVFILDDVKRTEYVKLASVVMDYDHLAAEQVGYITAPLSTGSALRLEMSGGEFCGNAVLSAAAMVGRLGICENNSGFYIESSGAQEKLYCEIKQLNAERFWAKAEMPGDFKIEDLRFRADGKTYKGKIVFLSGICHFICNCDLEDEEYDKIMLKLVKRFQQRAYGIIPYKQLENGRYQIRPFVYVSDTGSRVFECACGSGSLALGLALANGKEENFQVIQPCGEIAVSVGEKNYIAAEVFFSSEGQVFIEE